VRAGCDEGSKECRAAFVVKKETINDLEATRVRVAFFFI
jgi:hypothetical protein